MVTGCLVQRYGDELSSTIPEVDYFLPLQDEKKIVSFVEEILGTQKGSIREDPSSLPKRSLLTPFHTAYLKISEGCSNRCTYCTIPMIRGPHQSKEIPDLLEEARRLSAQGVKELILIGQDITRFGNDRNKPDSLVPLLGELARINNLQWIRLMYVHPDHLNDKIIHLIASEEKIIPYLDFPIQHIHNTILKKMNRKRNSSQIREWIDKLRQAIPDLVLRTSLIVGFPGETEEAFRELYNFVKEIRFDHLGLFTYSKEEGTRAASFPDPIDKEVKTARREKIMQLQARISEENIKTRIGTTLKTLVEGPSPETDLLLAGRYYGQAPEIDGLVLINKGEAVVGEFYDVKITETHTYDLVGEIVN